MTDAFKTWRSLAVHYRLFFAFGFAWFAIVLTMSPVAGSRIPAFTGDQEAAAPPAIQGTLGAVSTPSTPGNDLFSPLTEPTDVFDPGAGFEGFEDPSADEQPPTDENDGGGGDEPPPPPPCPPDAALPAPAARPAVDAVGGAQGTVEGATGEPAPGDPAGTAEGALCTPASSSSVVIGGLRPIDMIRLLLGFPPLPKS